MKTLNLTISFVLISIFCYSQVFINEFEPNPDGGDPENVSIEIKGAPNTAFSGYLLSVECDKDKDIGEVQDAEAISGTFDGNGLLVVSIPDLENPSFTLILVDAFTGSKGSTDIDTNNDGVVDDTSSFTTVYDAIGIPDNSSDESSLYGTDLGGVDFKYVGGTSGEPFLVFRDAQSNDLYAVQHPGDTEIYTTAGDPVPTSNFNGNPAMTSFGTPNAYETTLATSTEELNTFKLYPNPVSGPIIHIKGEKISGIKVVVYDQIGKPVLERSLNDNQLDVSSLNSGIYILKLQQKNQQFIKKLIVK